VSNNEPATVSEAEQNVAAITGVRTDWKVMELKR